MTMERKNNTTQRRRRRLDIDIDVRNRKIAARRTPTVLFLSCGTILLFTVGYTVRLIYYRSSSGFNEQISSGNKQIESSNPQNTSEQILRILAAAKITNINDEYAKKLPTWEDITSMYGDKPVIHGLETCDQYRKMVKPTDRTIGPAGLFNTGTNLMWKMLTNNCNIYGEILWQAPWGKHALPSNRLKRVAWDGEGVNQTEFFPFTMIKDPFTWMSSQCRHGYGVTFWNSEYDEEHCPHLIRENVRDHDETAPVQLFSGGKFHDTLLDAYNYWYGEWEAERMKKYPHLAIRYEDLLFHGEEVSRIACECVGGNLTADFKFESDSAKGSEGLHEGASGLVKALIQYGNPTTRLSGFTARDLSYARKNNATAKLMKEYAYSDPVL